MLALLAVLLPLSLLQATPQAAHLHRLLICHNDAVVQYLQRGEKDKRLLTDVAQRY